jgi:hypothetical protein
MVEARKKLFDKIISLALGLDLARRAVKRFSHKTYSSLYLIINSYYW